MSSSAICQSTPSAVDPQLRGVGLPQVVTAVVERTYVGGADSGLGCLHPERLSVASEKMSQLSYML